MVKKLIKHEFSALGRLMLPVLAAVLAIGIFTKIIFLFESDTTAYTIIEGSSYFLLVVAIIASFVLAVIFAVVRYYKNLFSCEGYLSFTLPVTAGQHLFVKALAAVTFQIATAIVAILTLLIALPGEVWAEVYTVVVEPLNELSLFINPVHFVFWAIEIILIFISSMIYNCFLYYTCITIGQTAKKNRIIFAVAVYFAYYIIMQILTTVVTVIISVASYTNIFEPIGLFIEVHPYLWAHGLLIGLSILNCVLTLIAYLICHKIIRKKLNLE